MIRIQEPGEIIGKVFHEGLLIEANNVTLRNCKIDGNWKDEEMYGIKMTTNRDGRPRRGLILDDVEVCNFWGKGILASNVFAKECYVHDIASDGFFRQLWGGIRIEDCLIERLGLDPQGTGEFKDRKGRNIHADGIQSMGGGHTHILGTTIHMNQGYGDGRVGNACIYIEADDAPVWDTVIKGCELKGANHLIRIRDEPSGKPAWMDDTRVTDTLISRCLLTEPWSVSLIFETEGTPEVKNCNIDMEPRKDK